jgi:DNA-binding beta-propeller fold protein YncE
MICRFKGAVAAALLILPLLPSDAQAQMIVSGNDGKAVLVDGVNQVPNNPSADYVAVIDLGAKPPKVVAEILAPASVVGPPQSLAVAADESFALVTSAMKLDPKDGKKLVPDNTITVIDLKASPPSAIGTAQARAGAAGIAINRAGTLALVANRSEGTVSIFTVADKKLTAAGKIDFGNPRSGPSAVAFTPDGKRALVSRDGDNKISVLSVDGSKVEYAKRDINAGLRPYSMEIARNGAFAIVGNIGLGQGDADTISLIDLKVEPPRIADTVSVGQTPEGVAISPDGKFAVANVVNGSNKPKASPFFNDFGLVKVFAIKGTKLTPVSEAKVGHWCQGVAWSTDGKTLVVQCMVESELQIFSFNGRTLKRSGGIKLSSGPAGIGVAGR